MTVHKSIAKIRRLMPTDLSRSVNPQLLAKGEETIEGTILLKHMGRLEGLLSDYQGVLKYSLSFYINDRNQSVIDTEISTFVSMECQRCLEAFGFELSKQSKLAVVRNKSESDLLTTDYEPLLLEDDELRIESLVEDELLLALPLSPMHEINECRSDMNEVETSEIKNEERHYPFSNLSSLIKDKD